MKIDPVLGKICQRKGHFCPIVQNFGVLFSKMCPKKIIFHMKISDFLKYRPCFKEASLQAYYVLGRVSQKWTHHFFKLTKKN